MYKTVFVDLDDTIWDTYANGRESMEEVYRDYRFDRFFPNFNTYYQIYYPNNIRLWKEYREGKISKDELIVERLYYPLKPYLSFDKDFLLSLNKDFLNRTTFKTKLLPHAMEALEYLYPKYKLYILSNGFMEVQYKKIDNSGLSKYFSDIILSESVGVHKPHIDIFNKALEIAGATPRESIMLGDSWDADIEGAKKAGIDQIWLDLGIEKQGSIIPTFHIKSLSEIKTIL